MVNLERHDEILAILADQKLVTVSKLAKMLYVSEATIRRDLIHMSNLGLIRRTHGGAMKAKNAAQESSFAMRETENLTAKKTVCRLALELIPDNSTIYIDSSSTIMPIIPMLQKFHHLTVVTHGIKTALMLSNSENIDVYIAGGRIENYSNSILGNTVTAFYDQIYADIALMSGSGINAWGDITDNNLENAMIKQKILQKAKKIYMLLDHTKFDKTLMNTCCNLRDVDCLVTDSRPSEAYLSIIASSGCRLVTQ